MDEITSDIIRVVLESISAGFSQNQLVESYRIWFCDYSQ